MNEKKVKRFDIYMCDFGTGQGSIQGGLRPVLVIQNDKLNKFSSTTLVAAITTVIKKEHLPSHVYLGQRFGLHKPSMVMFEQVKTVNQSELRSYIGHVDDLSTLNEIAYAIKKTLNIKIDTPKKSVDVRCLCPKCMEEYRKCGKYIVRRLDPFQRSKDKCIKCSRPGWDYIISERKYPC